MSNYEEAFEFFFERANSFRKNAKFFLEQAELNERRAYEIICKMLDEEAEEEEIEDEDEKFFKEINLKKARKANSRRKAARANKRAARKARKNTEGEVFGYGKAVYARTQVEKAFVKRETRRAARRTARKEVSALMLEEVA